MTDDPLDRLLDEARATSRPRPDEVARLRGLSPEEFVPAGMLQAFVESERGAHVPTEVA